MPRKAKSKEMPARERGGFKQGGKPVKARGLGGDILGGLGKAITGSDWGGHLGRGIGDAVGSIFGFRKGGVPKRVPQMRA